MSSFYSLPRGIVKALIDDQKLHGTVFCPLDREDALADQLRGLGYETTNNQDEEVLFDDSFWVRLNQKYDYIICVTAGDSVLADHVCNWGMLVARKAVIILDRITFLEPVKKRREFLQSHRCSNMVVLNPRPQYRVMGSTKDSVTSCWFTFRRKNDWEDGTHISYGVDWAACKPSIDEAGLLRVSTRSVELIKGDEQEA